MDVCFDKLNLTPLNYFVNPHGGTINDLLNLKIYYFITNLKKNGCYFINRLFLTLKIKS